VLALLTAELGLDITLFMRVAGVRLVEA